MNEIWRIENYHGEGPYHNRDLNWDDYPWAWDQKWYHPLPHEDPLLSAKYYSQFDADTSKCVYQFGFASVEQYIKWFNKRQWRQKLSHLGFSLKKFRSHDAIFGVEQVMFDRQSAALIETHSPNAFDDRFGAYWEIR